MSKISSWNRIALLGCTAMTSLTAALLMVSANAYADDGELGTVVVTGTRFNATVAPAKASLETMEPQTIIDRSYIEDSITPTADYVTILAIVPSLTGTDPNGPGLSEGNVKNTMRGMPDGQYGMTYDGIPFGDTNGPSHHSLSYFPGSTIGSINVERGPGNAGTLGPATYGGSINMFSDVLSDDMHGKASLSYGTWNTTAANVNVQSGDTGGALPTRVLLNLSEIATDGALSFQKLKQDNILLKVESQLNDNWTLTLFGTYSALKESLNDSNGLTPAQIAKYGKYFALQDRDPALPNYYAYNNTNKYTDMDYARIKGTVVEGLKVDNTAYTYAYKNWTVSARNVTQTLAQINAHTAQGMGGSSTPVVGGVKQPASDIPGYQKLNSFRVIGDIFRVSQDYNIGSVSGQIRAGVWWEKSDTPRARWDLDVTKCHTLGIHPFYDVTTACQDSSLTPKSAVQLKNKPDKFNNGFAEFLEKSSWNQYQPFLELEIRPTDDLTITPGIKYLNWEHSTDSQIEPKLLKPFKGSFTTKDTLKFLEANYKIQQSWSVYAQYAEGIYVPDINAFEQKTTVFKFPDAQTTTNYQIGTVYYADNFTFDADYYYIPVKNNIVFQNCALTGGPVGDTCGVNTGEATYKGFEGEATYAFNEDDAGGALRGVALFVNGSTMSSKSGGLWLKQAPAWTAAGGIIYKHDGLKLSLIEKIVGSQYSDKIQDQNYKIPSYGNLDFNAGYDFGTFEFDVSVNNVLDSRKVVSITENDAVYQVDRMKSLDQYFYQAPRSFLATIKAHF